MKAGKGNKFNMKARGYIEDLFNSEEFKTTKKAVRKKHFEDQNNFHINTFDDLVIADIYPRIPENVINKEKYILSINNLLIRYGFSQEWFDIFSDYILFNYIGDLENKKQFFLLNLGHRNKKDNEDRKKFEDSLYQNPIILMIPPSASQRDIADFISGEWNRIESIQEKYSKKLIKIVKTRRKNDRVKRRNNFIYKNKDLPKKDLISAVADNFGDIMDYTYLSKIIVAETKKRSVNG